MTGNRPLRARSWAVGGGAAEGVNSGTIPTPRQVQVRPQHPHLTGEEPKHRGRSRSAESRRSQMVEPAFQFRRAHQRPRGLPPRCCRGKTARSVCQVLVAVTVPLSVLGLRGVCPPPLSLSLSVSGAGSNSVCVCSSCPAVSLCSASAGSQRCGSRHGLLPKMFPN